MRFKAKLTSEQVAFFYSLLLPLTRLAPSENSQNINLRRKSILFLDDENLRISAKGRTVDTDGIACLAELKAKDGIFLEHRIESASENNSILLELDLVQMKTAFQSFQQDRQDFADSHVAHLVVLKLAKRRNAPCLVVEGIAKGGVEVQQTIHVRVCRASELQQHLPPTVTQPHVQLELTTEKPLLRVLVERLKHLAATVLLTASTSGDLTIQMDNDGVSIRTFVSSLTPRLEGCKPGVDSCTVRVDTKKLTVALAWQQQVALSESAILCLVENEMLVLHVKLHPESIGFVTYYVPVHLL